MNISVARELFFGRKDMEPDQPDVFARRNVRSVRRFTIVLLAARSIVSSARSEVERGSRMKPEGNLRKSIVK